MTQAQKKSLESPDQVLHMDLGKIDIVEIGGSGVGRATFEPGWRWSEHEKPFVDGGEYCEVPHFVYLASGRLHLLFDDGEELDLESGDVATIPAGHDGWVVGDEPATMFDFAGVAKVFEELSPSGRGPSEAGN